MIRVVPIIIVSWFLGACSSGHKHPDYARDNRIAYAQSLEQQNRLSDALIQWSILHTLYPQRDEISVTIQRLNQVIDSRKNALQKKLNSVPKNNVARNVKKRKRILLQMLALTPDDMELKDSIGNMTRDSALAEATEKTDNILKYFKVNQEKAEKSIALANLLKQGEAIIASGEFIGLLPLAEKLDKLSPGHKEVKRYRLTAYSLMAEASLKNNEPKKAINYFEKAANLGSKKEASRYSKQATSLRKKLSNDFFEKGQKVFSQNIKQAIEYFEQTLAYDPAHSKAKQQLLRATTIQKNLEKIQSMQED